MCIRTLSALHRFDSRGARHSPDQLCACEFCVLYRQEEDSNFLGGDSVYYLRGTATRMFVSKKSINRYVMLILNCVRQVYTEGNALLAE